MSELVFFDSHGAAVAYKDEGDDVIFLWDGRPVAILDEESVFFFDGRHAGWFFDGWIRDHQGGAVYFTDRAQGGPVRPVRQVRSVRGVRQVRPVRGVRQMRPIRPVWQLAWSQLSTGPAFFLR
jgi:hypothetical protein